MSIIIKYIETCFGVNHHIAHNSDIKGFYATLGKGVVNMFLNPYRVTSGIFVGDEVRKKGEYFNMPNKIFFEDGDVKTKKKKFDNIIPVSSMFFGTS